MTHLVKRIQAFEPSFRRYKAGICLRCWTAPLQSGEQNFGMQLFIALDDECLRQDLQKWQEWYFAWALLETSKFVGPHSQEDSRFESTPYLQTKTMPVIEICVRTDNDP